MDVSSSVSQKFCFREESDSEPSSCVNRHSCCYLGELNSRRTTAIKC